MILLYELKQKCLLLGWSGFLNNAVNHLHVIHVEKSFSTDRDQVVGEVNKKCLPSMTATVLSQTVVTTNLFLLVVN